jgi:nucleoid-associated protein YgaU
MAISRYQELLIVQNEDPDYKKLFKKKFENRQSFPHLESQSLEYPSIDEIKRFTFANHIWKLGDRYYKLAHHYYGDSKYWWVIAWFNKKPTEQHVSIGDLVKIPLPLNDVLDSYGL